MVGNSTAKAAEMALQLSSTYKWCITGTPIQRGLFDLQGLFMFLQIPILEEANLFKKYIQKPIEFKETRFIALNNLIHLCKSYFWRSSKEDVKEELFIPSQGEKIHNLRLTPIESHFYKKQHQACSDATMNALIRSREHKLTNKQMSSLLNSLLRLRQACCHPQIGNHSVGIQIQKTPLTMEQLLDQLILKAKIECEETQRHWIVSSSALAALKILQAQRSNEISFAIEASSLYREMIKIAKENENLFDVDSIQLLHIYYNLSLLIGKTISNLKLDEKLSTFSEEIKKHEGNSIIDDSLCEIIKNIRKNYTSKNKLLIMQSLSKFNNFYEKLENQIKNTSNRSWWNILFKDKSIKVNENQMISKIKDNLLEMNGKYENYKNHPKSLCYRFYAFSQLEFIIQAEIQNLHHLRENIIKQIKQNQPSDDQQILFNQVKDIIDCPCKTRLKFISTTNENENILSCHSCKIFRQIATYEQCLFFDFSVSNTKTTTDGLSRSKQDPDLLIILQSILKILSSNEKNENLLSIQNEIKDDIEIIKQMSKEIKYIRQLWESHRNFFLSIDELQQATSRIQLRNENDEISENEKSYKILPYEIIPLSQKYSGERKLSFITLNQKKGQLKYLLNLGKKQVENSSLHNDDNNECVICRESIGDHLVILACGHEFCSDCITDLIVRSHGTLKCPTCRARMNSDEIAYISNIPSETIQEKDDQIDTNDKKQEKPEENDPNQQISNLIPVSGSWGTKIESVVREILRIKKEDPNAKSLIFSQWTEVLEIIYQALQQNNISATQICTSNRKKQYAALHSYRFLPSISVLLLPLKKGANGLNLIEATHVFLVEPLLNPAAEAQAIGRVHRIGQTQNTFVHRFIVENTIEEKIHSINVKRKEKHSNEYLLESDILSVDDQFEWKMNKSEKDCMTTDDLCELFDISDDSIESNSDIIDQNPVHFPQPVVDRFWNTFVHFEDKILTRHAVSKLLESKHSLRLLNAKTPIVDKVCNLYSVKLPHVVAKQVMKLKEVDEDAE